MPDKFGARSNEGNIFSNNRERIGGKEPIIFERNARFERKITRADQVRFQENSHFAEVIYEELIRLIDGKISPEQLQSEAQKLSEHLSSPQQKVLEKICQNILTAQEGRVHSRGITLRSLYEEQRLASYDLFLNYAKYAWGIMLGGRISFSDVSVTPWGAVCVTISNPDTWAEIEKATDAINTDGFKITIGYGPQIPNQTNYYTPYTPVNDERYIKKQANRTIVINASDKSQEKLREIKRHELFHELYDSAISPAQKSRYRNKEMVEAFEKVKNEMVAYAFSRMWQADEDLYFPTSYRREGASPIEKVRQWVLASVLVGRLPKEERTETEFASPEEILKHCKIRLGEAAFEESQKKAMSFVIEMANVWREIARLKIIGSQSFDQASRVFLTAQSFNEISYKLAQIDLDKKVDAVDAAVTNGSLDLKKAEDVIICALYFCVPIARLDELVLHLQKELDQNNGLSTEERDDCRRCIDYYHANSNRWIKPGEQRD